MELQWYDFSVRSKCKEDDVKMKLAFFKEKLTEQLGSIYTELILAVKPIFIGYERNNSAHIQQPDNLVALCNLHCLPFAFYELHAGWMLRRRLARTLAKADGQMGLMSLACALKSKNLQFPCRIQSEAFYRTKYQV